MRPLTNGLVHLEPAPTSFPSAFQPLISPELCFESQIRYGPHHERVEALGEDLWWSDFGLEERLRLTIYARPSSRLSIEILDAQQQVLAGATSLRGRATVEVQLSKRGRVCFRIVNLEAVPDAYFLQLIQVLPPPPSAVSPAPRRRPQHPLRDVARALRLKALLLLERCHAPERGC